MQAIANRDLRCASCHASGSSADTASAVASPHKRVTAENPLPPGKVWSDPADDWKASFEATTGGGHNGLSASFVGASASKRFPITSFGIAGKTYNWTLPPNSGTTAWLKASVLGTAAVSTPESMSHITITCDDCHSMPDDMAGPHGSSVHVGIDPEYSQTEYANPTPELYQFAATGTQRVICMKCHNMEATMDLSVSPGGAPLHSRHVRHDDLPTSDRHHYGEKCIDCHVRIPHAWKRPRLLVRTVETTDGAVADEYPYVPAGYDGLAGIVLRDYTSLSDLRSRYCATNGCHPSPTVTRHPLPSQIPTAPFWP